MFTRTAASHPVTRRFALTAATALTALSLGMADAQATTVGRIFGEDLNEIGNDRILYEGAVGHDALTITKVGLSMVFEDPTQTITPTDSHCVQNTTHKVTCASKNGFAEGQIETVQAWMGDGDDDVSIFADAGIGVSASGEGGEDRLVSDGHRHALYGGQEADELIGKGGNDILMGNEGPDHIEPGAGEDEVYGGAAADTIKAQDGEIDEISCGDGIDTLSADANDVRSSCEINGGLQLQPPAPQPPAPQPPVADPPVVPGDGSAGPAAGGSVTPVPPAGSQAAPGAITVRALKVGVKTLKVSRRGRLVVRVSCPKTAAGACKVALSGRGVSKRTITVKAGAAKTVTLKLTGARRTAAKRGKAVRLSLSVAASDTQLLAAAVKVKVVRRAR